MLLTVLLAFIFPFIGFFLALRWSRTCSTIADNWRGAVVLLLLFVMPVICMAALIVQIVMKAIG